MGNAGMKKEPTLKDMQDILNGIRPIKRDFLEEPPDVPQWAPLTVSFYDEKAQETDEYFESANEPLAGSVAPQPKLANNKPLKKKQSKITAPQQMSANTKFNFGQNLKKSESKGPPTNPMQQQQMQQPPAFNPVQQMEEKEAASSVDDAAYVWICHLDADSGDVFYEKISDGTTQWDRPDEAIKPHWLAHLDADSGELYFENIETQQTQWDPPPCFVEKVPDQEWLRHFDPTSGEYYYENVRTQQTQWDPPKGAQFN